MGFLKLLYFKSVLLFIFILPLFPANAPAEYLESLSLVDGPSFTEGPYADSRHMGNDRGESQYGLRFYFRLTDPQGFTDIASAVVTGPTGLQYTITDPDYDGWYDLWTSNLSSPPPFGTYTFRITDKSGNWIEASDNINAVIDYPRNVSPSHSGAVTAATPQFSWDAVTGAVKYHLQVTNSSGSIIWNKDNITAGPVTFNDDASASETLIAGNEYRWGIYCSDAAGNRGEQYYWIPFIYSTSTVSPILTSPSAKSGHYGNDSGSQDYILIMGVRVYDPQGLSDIESIKVTATGGSVYQMTDSNSDGNYDGWFSGLSTPPLAGSYIIRATDKSGNWAEKVEVMTGSIDYPKNIHPLANEVVSTPSPVFSWDPIAGSVRNEIWINDINGHTIWGRWDMSGSSTSVTFNYDGNASEPLKEGSIYRLAIRAFDNNGNWGQNWETRFAYSSNTIKPIIGNHEATTSSGGSYQGNDYKNYNFSLVATDPQGLSDIASVNVMDPGGRTIALTDPDGDGQYYGNTDVQSPYLLGQCLFTVTDKSGNTAMVLDTLHAWISYAKSIKPLHNELVTTATPVLKWEKITGPGNYYIWVNNTGGGQVWSVSVSNNDSATYNYNGTGTPLQEGMRYNWSIGTNDNLGNSGNYSAGEFMYATSTDNPIIINPIARTVHSGDDSGYNYYNLHLSVQIADPQGLSDIESVNVTGPDLKSYKLTDDNNDGYYDCWSGSPTDLPAVGTYVFRVTDKSGNWIELTKNVSAVLNFPKNLKPLKNEVVNTPTPTFSWDAIEGSTYYIINIWDANGKWIWGKSNFTSASVTFNDNGTAIDSLKDGNSYSFNVSGYDADGNYGEQNGRLFYYSTSTINPILTGIRIRSNHWKNVDYPETWSLDCRANIIDPQGLDDLDSAWITGPKNQHIRLYDDNTNGDGTANDSQFTNYYSGLVSPDTGVYIFKAVDKSGNLVTINDTLFHVLDLPENLNITHNSIITDPEFTISWDIVNGASRYVIEIVNSERRNTWYYSLTADQTSTLYNANNLSDGGVYYLSLRAEDTDGSQSQLSSIKFAYRSDGRKTIYVDTLNTSGTENGTLELPYNTLKEAIDNSLEADTVYVAPGIYQGGIDNVGSITLIGKDPVSTIIKGGYLGMNSSNSSISGFHIMESDAYGIVIRADTNIRISNNIISDNPQHGIAMGWNGPVKAIIKNNTIVRNLSNGISIENDASDITITNNIITHNGSGIYTNTGSVIKNSYNDLFGNSNNFINVLQGVGDILLDPEYANSQEKNYSLTSSSPALDAGDPDPDGDGVSWSDDADDRDPDTTRMDMGAVFLDQRLLVPEIPANLTAVSCNDLIILKWNKNPGPYFLRYRIYGGSSSDTETIIDSTSNNIADTTKTIDGLIHGQTYYYRVVAMNRGGKTSDYSNQVTTLVQTGVIPKIKSKWSGDVLICYNQGDSITQFKWYNNGTPASNGNGQYYVAGKQNGVYHVETIDINGCKNISRELIVSGSKALTAYPNPASVSFVLKLNYEPEGRARVSIINASGKKVLEFQTENTQGEILGEIPVSGLEDGIYYINVQMNNKESYNTKIVITR